MNTQDLKGMIYVVADHSHTDRQCLQKVVTRFQKTKPDDVEWDAQRLMAYGKLHAEELRDQKGAKSRHSHKKIYVVQILEVIDVIEND